MILITTVNVKMTLKQAERYFDMMKTGRIKRSATSQIAISLTRHLWGRVFTDNISDIYEIEDAAEMRELIRSKGFPRMGSYNQDYLDWKLIHAPYPHEISGELKSGVYIDIMTDKVLFYTSPSATTRTRVSHQGPLSQIQRLPGAGPPPGYKVSMFNFGPIHERRKSILKATVVFAWQDIKKRVGNTYKTYAEGV